LWDVCEERAIGEPCPVEAREFAEFVGRLVDAFDLAGDVAGQAHAEVLAMQRVRIHRGNIYLASLENGGWSDKTKEYILKELRNLEVAFTQGLGQLKSSRRLHRRVDLELRVLDPPIEERDDHPGSA